MLTRMFQRCSHWWWSLRLMLAIAQDADRHIDRDGRRDRRPDEATVLLIGCALVMLIALCIGAALLV